MREFDAVVAGWGHQSAKRNRFGAFGWLGVRAICFSADCVHGNAHDGVGDCFRWLWSDIRLSGRIIGLVGNARRPLFNYLTI